jgi:hypothetical protein
MKLNNGVTLNLADTLKFWLKSNKINGHHVGYPHAFLHPSSVKHVSNVVGREADHTPAPSAKVDNGGVIPPLQHT